MLDFTDGKKERNEEDQTGHFKRFIKYVGLDISLPLKKLGVETVDVHHHKLPHR